MRWRTYPSRVVMAFALVLVQAQAFGQGERGGNVTTAAPPASTQSGESQLYPGLEQLGIAAGDLFYTAARNGQSDPAWNAAKIRPDLENIQKSYVLGRDMSVQTGKLLNANLNVVFTGTDVVTEGASLIITAPARWMVSQSTSKLVEKMQEPVRAAFAADLMNYVNSPPSGSCLASLPCTTLTETDWDQINKLSSVRNLKSRLTNDDVGTDIVDSTVIGILTHLQRDELTMLAQHTQSIDSVENQLKNYNQLLTNYENSNDDALNELNDRVNNLEQSTDDELNSLNLLESKNGAQLAVIEDLMYSHASAEDKLALLQSGYGKDRMNENQFATLKSDLEVQATREAIQDDAQRALNVTQNLNTIAASLNLPPIVTDTLQDAGTWEGLVNSATSGNYLGTLAGVVSFFGHHGESPEQQMMHHMDQRFDHIDQELRSVLQGEQAIDSNIQQMSQQIDRFSRDTESHLYEIDWRLSSIQGMVQQETYRAAATCHEVEDRLSDVIFQVGQIPDLRDTEQLQFLPNVANYDHQINTCLEFLQFVEDESMRIPTQQAGFIFRPVAYAYLAEQGAVPTIPATSQDGTPDYETPASEYYKDVYSPGESYFLLSSANALPAFGIYAGTPAYQSLAYAALPVRDVPSLKSKLTAIGQKDAACTTSTSLSVPVFKALCPGIDVYSPPDKAGRKMESQANDRAAEYLKSPIYLDAISDLSRWALFYSPLMDYQVDGKILRDPKAILNSPDVRPNGSELIDTALQLDTLGIAQANVIYGDVAAALVFNDLWSDDTGLLPDAPQPPKDANHLTQKEQAEALFTKTLGGNAPIAKNVYLQKNVLMIAMDRLWKYSPTTWDHAYEFALEFFAKSDSEPTYMLDVLFNPRSKPRKIEFGVRWVLMDGADPAIHCDSATGSDRAKNCIRVPTAQILGQSVDLPSVHEFSSRSLFYPQTMMDMIGYRDRLADSLAAYRTFDIAARNLKDRSAKAQLKNQLTKSLMEAVR